MGSANHHVRVVEQRDAPIERAHTWHAGQPLAEIVALGEVAGVHALRDAPAVREVTHLLNMRPALVIEDRVRAVEARAREALLVAQAPIVTPKREVVLARQRNPNLRGRDRRNI